jgi:thiamine transport system ATP-binding protein
VTGPAVGSTPRLEVRGASVRFGSVDALDGVDLAVAPGEVVAVLGPSGSGKSTLLRAIAGLQPLDGGTIALDGRDQRGVPPHRRDVGLMFQDHALFPHADVAGNVAFGLRMRGVDRSRAAGRVQDLLELVGLEGAGRRAVTTLSGGEQQRVALARALAPDPCLLMLDEPLGALDRPLRERLVGELRDIFLELGQTVVAVTHDHAEAFTLADRIVVMARGSVLQSGSAAEVWSAPATGEVARFLGFENLVAVRIRDGVAATPWGDVEVGAQDGDGTVLVRGAGVRLDDDGPIAGAVERVRFRGATTVVTIAVDGAPPLVAEIPTAVAPASGDRVRARLVPDEVVVIAS